MVTPRRGLRELRTLSGRVDQLCLPYRAYMQITCLEMEKARRRNERKSASQRIADIDGRLKEIEAEKARLLQAVEGRGNGQPVRDRGFEVKPTPRRSTGGFRLRY